MSVEPPNDGFSLTETLGCLENLVMVQTAESGSGLFCGFNEVYQEVAYSDDDADLFHKKSVLIR